MLSTIWLLRIPLLGEFGMPSEQAAHGASGAPEDQTVERVLALLAEALEIADALKLSPEIGAKLQEVIIAIEERQGLSR
jgi:hypothetical protein